MAKDAAPKAVPTPQAARFLPTRFEATHKKVFGGCTGQLELTAARLHFTCPDQPDLNFPVDVIAKVHKDGVVLKSGEKYHFVIANHTKDQAEAIFESWLSRVQQMPQAGRTLRAFLKAPRSTKFAVIPGHRSASGSTCLPAARRRGGRAPRGSGRSGCRRGTRFRGLRRWSGCGWDNP